MSDTCDENADCTNNDGSYACTCKQGFTGDGSTCLGNHINISNSQSFVSLRT